LIVESSEQQGNLDAQGRKSHLLQGAHFRFEENLKMEIRYGRTLFPQELTYANNPNPNVCMVNYYSNNTCIHIITSKALALKNQKHVAGATRSWLNYCTE
jgi:hypothetical protein